MRVTVPGSSANLGPGFDALGLAVALPFVFAVNDDDDDLLTCEATHPAAVAYAAAGGTSTRLAWRSPIPPGRGLGFSGAARVAGALAGVLETDADSAAVRQRALTIASRLEQHPDNAAASLLGGLVVAAAGHAIRVPMALDVRLVVWWPESETSTRSARAALPERVPFVDAVHNVGRTALLIAALVTGTIDVLADATDDRLHTASRLARSPASAAALARLADTDVLATWLSGSGPTVAALVLPDRAERVAESLSGEGNVRVLDIDLHGARVSRAA